jgi:hypothetical protein
LVLVVGELKGMEGELPDLFVGGGVTAVSGEEVTGEPAPPPIEERRNDSMSVDETAKLSPSL